MNSLQCVIYSDREFRVYLLDKTLPEKTEAIRNHIDSCHDCLHKMTSIKEQIDHEATFFQSIGGGCGRYSGAHFVASMRYELPEEKEIEIDDHLDNCNACFIYYTKIEKHVLSRESKKDHIRNAERIFPAVEANTTENAQVQVDSGAIRLITLPRFVLVATAAILIIYMGVTVIGRAFWDQANPVNIENLIRAHKLDQSEALLKQFSTQPAMRSDMLLKAQYLYLSGRLDSERGLLGKAAGQLKEAAVIAAELNNKDLLAKISLNLMNLYHVKNDNQQALEYADKVYVLAVELGNYRNQALSLKIKGISQYLLKDRENGCSNLKQALLLAISRNESAIAARCHSYFAIIHSEEGQFIKAKDDIEYSLALIEQVKDPHEREYARSMTHGYTARCLALSGQWDKAIENYEKAIELADNIGIQQYLLLSQYHNGLADSMIAASKDKAKIEEEIATAAMLEEKAYSQCQLMNPFLTAAVTTKPIPMCD